MVISVLETDTRMMSERAHNSGVGLTCYSASTTDMATQTQTQTQTQMRKHKRPFCVIIAFHFEALIANNVRKLCVCIYI